MERNLRKTRTGKVVSDKMDKTIVVAVEDHVKHPLHDFAVKRMLNVVNYCNNDCLVHLIAYYFTDTNFSQISFHNNYSFLL